MTFLFIFLELLILFCVAISPILFSLLISLSVAVVVVADAVVVVADAVVVVDDVDDTVDVVVGVDAVFCR